MTAESRINAQWPRSVRPFDRSRTTMLERGVEVLQAFRPTGGTLTLTALVERTGLPKATVHRLAELLVNMRLLERAQTGYRLGLELFELGELVPAKNNLREYALPFMQDLYEMTHETIHLAIRDNLDVVYAEKIRGHSGVEVPTRVGGRLPLSSTAVGKAMLAYCSPEVINEVTSRPLRRLTAHSIVDPAVLKNQLVGIRKSGLAYDEEEGALGVSCVASAVLVNGQSVAALSVSFATCRTATPGYAHAVRAVSLALGRALSQARSA
jgi:DNA-binding IclR family transcriptional regulator